MFQINMYVFTWCDLTNEKEYLRSPKRVTIVNLCKMTKMLASMRKSLSQNTFNIF